MKKAMRMLLHVSSWFMLLMMGVYIIEIIFGLDFYMIDDIFRALHLERGRVALFFEIGIIVSVLISIVCLVRYIFIRVSAKKRRSSK